jgi:hypothetical protein
MSTTPVTDPGFDHELDHEGERRSLPLLVAAGLLVVLVVAGVWLFGTNRPPELLALADEPAPAPPSAVAWMVWSNRESCVRVARPDGTVDEVWCDREGGELVGWEGDHLLITRWGHRSFDVEEPLVEEGAVQEVRVLEVDATSGEVVDTRWVDERSITHHGGTGEVVSYRQGGELVVEYGRTEVWRVAAAETYTVRDGSVSPDGRALAIVDAADRLLVVPADGSAPPRIWAEDVSVWMAPVWQGSDLG